MYDFDGLRNGRFSERMKIEVKEPERNNCERTVAWMSVKDILMKFG